MKNFIQKSLRKYLTEDYNQFNINDVEVSVLENQNTVSFVPFIPINDDIERLGSFRVNKIGNDYKINQVTLKPEYRKKGIGKAMYLTMVEYASIKGGKLYSDDNQTQDAKYIWESLIKMGLALKTKNGYVSKN